MQDAGLRVKELPQIKNEAPFSWIYDEDAPKEILDLAEELASEVQVIEAKARCDEEAEIEELNELKGVIVEEIRQACIISTNR
jgi:hypothetical protein